MTGNDLLTQMTAEAQGLRERERIPQEFRVCIPVAVELIEEVWGSGASGRYRALCESDSYRVTLIYPHPQDVPQIAFFYI